MKCSEFKAKMLVSQKPFKRMFYQKMPGGGSYDPNIAGTGPVNSIEEFDFKTDVLSWDDEAFVAVVRNACSNNIELFSTLDDAHKDDVRDVIPGTTLAVIGLV